LKVDLHFVLDLNHSATNTDGSDSKISLLRTVCVRVGLAGLFHGQADRFGDTVQRQITIDLPLSIGQFLDAEERKVISGNFFVSSVISSICVWIVA